VFEEKRNKKLPSHTLREDDLHLDPTLIQVTAQYSQISLCMQAMTTIHQAGSSNSDLGQLFWHMTLDKN